MHCPSSCSKKVLWTWSDCTAELGRTPPNSSFICNEDGNNVSSRVKTAIKACTCEIWSQSALQTCQYATSFHNNDPNFLNHYHALMEDKFPVLALCEGMGRGKVKAKAKDVGLVSVTNMQQEPDVFLLDTEMIVASLSSSSQMKASAFACSLQHSCPQKIPQHLNPPQNSATLTRLPFQLTSNSHHPAPMPASESSLSLSNLSTPIPHQNSPNIQHPPVPNLLTPTPALKPAPVSTLRPVPTPAPFSILMVAPTPTPMSNHQHQLPEAGVLTDQQHQQSSTAMPLESASQVLSLPLSLSQQPLPGGNVTHLPSINPALMPAGTQQLTTEPHQYSGGFVFPKLNPHPASKAPPINSYLNVETQDSNPEQQTLIAETDPMSLWVFEDRVFNKKEWIGLILKCCKNADMVYIPTKNKNSPENLCGGQWMSLHPEGTNVQFVAYWKDMPPDEKRIWFSKSKELTVTKPTCTPCKKKNCAFIVHLASNTAADPVPQ
ncbi:hypothetical protein P691DRAFT_782822 [Macrolepiota fuliginosa MF-IS2]|uniref:Uncharacterized protein n=1 Tax=Macrolepiota fuliginosa MF-IS2 TaxID=1400762 RepID=A0A9P5WWI4_9AGAR|nr:hypothetical protein P691DRAFT_782822 [Macrolepiota fuliginosa MF-IS2]